MTIMIFLTFGDRADPQPLILKCLEPLIIPVWRTICHRCHGDHVERLGAQTPLGDTLVEIPTHPTTANRYNIKRNVNTE